MDRFALNIDRSKDNAVYYVIPGVRAFFNWRLKAALSMFGRESGGDILDVGYGAGFLLRLLDHQGCRLYGVDIHAYGSKVRHSLSRREIDLQIARGGVLSLPFKDGSFDTVFCLSLLEHVIEIDLAVDELHRVTKPGGRAILGFPPRTRLTSFLFDLIGFDHRKFHPTDHETILASIHQKFEVETMRRLPRAMSLYMLCRCKKRTV